MWLKRLLCLVLVTAVSSIPSTIHAIPACDNFGQDWDVTLGPFGGTYPGTLTVAGTRDSDGSLACSPGSGPFAVFGAAVITAASGGAPFSLLWSMTSFDTPADGCVSVAWRGSMPSTSTTVRGDFRNEAGGTGSFSLALGSTACRIESDGPDPSAP
jgi:hypothetical protein